MMMGLKSSDKLSVKVILLERAIKTTIQRLHDIRYFVQQNNAVETKHDLTPEKHRGLASRSWVNPLRLSDPKNVAEQSS